MGKQKGEVELDNLHAFQTKSLDASVWFGFLQDENLKLFLSYLREVIAQFAKFVAKTKPKDVFSPLRWPE